MKLSIPNCLYVISTTKCARWSVAEEQALPKRSYRYDGLTVLSFARNAWIATQPYGPTIHLHVVKHRPCHSPTPLTAFHNGILGRSSFPE